MKNILIAVLVLVANTIASAKMAPIDPIANFIKDAPCDPVKCVVVPQMNPSYPMYCAVSPAYSGQSDTLCGAFAASTCEGVGLPICQPSPEAPDRCSLDSDLCMAEYEDTSCIAANCYGMIITQPDAASTCPSAGRLFVCPFGTTCDIFQFQDASLPLSHPIACNCPKGSGNTGFICNTM
jgi:hypothetical protein